MNVKLEWNDSIEHTLDMIRLNCVNLSEYHQQRYNVYKSRTNTYRVPIFLMSSANAYAAVGIHKYLSQEYISDINCGVSVLIALIVVVQYLMSYQHQTEEELIKFKEYYTLSAQIFKILNIERTDRKIDGNLFLQEKFGKYQELVSTSNIIQEYKDGLLEMPDNMITKYIADTKELNDMSKYLFDHWNILYQPKLYALKKQNANVLKYLRETWKSTFDKKEDGQEQDVENPSAEDGKKEEKQLVENPFYNPFSYDIFKNDFMKERLEKDQNDLEKVRKQVPSELRKQASNRVSMAFL